MKDERKKALIIAVGDEEEAKEAVDHEHEIEFLDDEGNGSLKMAEGHTHAVVGGEVQPVTIDGETHTHELEEDEEEE